MHSIVFMVPDGLNTYSCRLKMIKLTHVWAPHCDADMEDQMGPTCALMGSTCEQPWGVTFSISYGGSSLVV